MKLLPFISLFFSVKQSSFYKYFCFVCDVSSTFMVSFNFDFRDVFSPILVSYFGEVALMDDLDLSFKTGNDFPFH